MALQMFSQNGNHFDLMLTEDPSSSPGQKMNPIKFHHLYIDLDFLCKQVCKKFYV